MDASMTSETITRRFYDTGDDLSALIKKTLVASGAQFANPWHDERGRFAPVGYTRSGAPLSKGSIEVLAGVHDAADRIEAGDLDGGIELLDAARERAQGDDVDHEVRHGIGGNYGKLGSERSNLNWLREHGQTLDDWQAKSHARSIREVADSIGVPGREGYAWEGEIPPMDAVGNADAGPVTIREPHNGFGNHQIHTASGRKIQVYGTPPDAHPGEVQAVKDTLAKLAERFPPSADVNVNLAGLGGHPVDAFKTASGLTVGHTRMTIDLANSRTMSGKNGMPAQMDMEQIVPTVVHEWGHVLGNYDLRYHEGINPEASWERPTADQQAQTASAVERLNRVFDANKADLSPYGQQNVLEGYAEAFQEWVLTNGQTRNAAARNYAKEYGW